MGPYSRLVIRGYMLDGDALATDAGQIMKIG